MYVFPCYEIYDKLIHSFLYRISSLAVEVRSRILQLGYEGHSQNHKIGDGTYVCSPNQSDSLASPKTNA